MKIFSSIENRAFTLVELLAVLVIVGILLGGSMAVFSSFGTSAGPKVAASQLASDLRLARQHAIRSRKETFIIFPDLTLNYAEEDRDKALSSYAIVDRKINSEDAAEYVSSWKYLPKGSSFFLSQVYVDKINVNGGFPEPFSATSTEMPVIMFKPNGLPYRKGSGNEWENVGIEIFIIPVSVVYDQGSLKQVLTQDKNIFDNIQHPKVSIKKYSGFIKISKEKKLITI